jgi:hypothetical protein
LVGLETATYFRTEDLSSADDVLYLENFDLNNAIEIYT